MLYYLLDQDFQIVDGVELFQSMIWTEKYYDIGDFELYLPATDENVNLYTEAAEKHYYLIRYADTRRSSLKSIPAMMVEKVKTDINVKNGKFIIVTGSQLKKVLYRRTAIQTRELAGNIQTELRNLVTADAIAPTNTDRVIPRLTLGDVNPELTGSDMVINYKLKGEYLSTIISTACKEKKLGWDVTIDITNRECNFVLYSGKNRTQSQSGDKSRWNSPVTFSIKNQNLIKTNYEVDYENYRNVAVVKSEYEQYNKTAKRTDTIDASFEVRPYKLDRNPVGYDRYEIFIDQGVETIQNENSEVDVLALSAKNTDKARSELDKYSRTIQVSAEVDNGVNFSYGEDYFLGDLVSIQNEFAQNMEGRVTSVTTTLSYNKNQTIPSFTIENYTGKIEDEKELLNPKDVRIDTSGETRCTTDGTIRKRATGYKFTGRITADGQERRTTYGDSRNCVKSELFDDSKYTKYYQGG